MSVAGEILIGIVGTLAVLLVMTWIFIQVVTLNKWEEEEQKKTKETDEEKEP